MKNMIQEIIKHFSLQTSSINNLPFNLVPSHTIHNHPCSHLMLPPPPFLCLIFHQTTFKISLIHNKTQTLFQIYTLKILNMEFHHHHYHLNNT
uniref:Uncharacterized protein n=1 Tax=Medicago truncatula TaxID=3880 RepID=I3SZP7_MEDTR|nr:unknown [Medicago truncatula]